MDRRRKQQNNFLNYFKKTKTIDDYKHNIQTENKNETTTQNVSQVAQTHGVTTSTSQDNVIHNVNDIRNYIGTTLNKITDQERYNIVCHPWVPPVNFNCPSIAQANKNGSFKLHWINEYPWLSYSQKRGGGFSRICVLFGFDERGRSRIKLGKLVTLPLSTYKKAKEDLKAHANNEYHKNNLFKSNNFIDVMSDKCTVEEYFIGFTKVENVTGENLTDTILRLLKENNLDISLLRGQGYDGAANMRGAFKGVQSRILKLQPLALYTHCANHKLNLVLNKASSIPLIRNTVVIITNINNFLREPAIRTNHFSLKIIELLPTQKVVKAKKLCDTRWVERHDGILHFSEILPTIKNYPKYYFEFDTPDEEILYAAQKYEADLPSSIEVFRGELCLWKELWKTKSEKADTPMEAYKSAYMFPNIECLLKILCIIPVTTATSEQSFSLLKRIKTYLRFTMNQSRLNGLAMLNIHKYIKITPEEVLDIFFTKHNRKLRLDI
ncbi:hypothetical protein QTP88_008247 [Uroleucon formosanum]